MQQGYLHFLQCGVDIGREGSDSVLPCFDPREKIAHASAMD